ncbi:MAG: signal peptide peptidase SppA [Chitinophagaceae bacterium]
MRSFFKIFFACFLALIIFCLVGFFLLVGAVAALGSKDKTKVDTKTVLTLNLSQHFKEKKQSNPFAKFSDDETDAPGLYDVIRLIRAAKTDNNISGIYIIANENQNGFASSHELRDALLDFKTSRKFIIAHGDVVSQKAYYVASVANHFYVSPMGAVEWAGLSAELPFLKGTLQKLNIEPQIFYAGKFKSATEPFRATEMTPANRLQTTVWLGNLYSIFLQQVSKDRNIDTATLHNLANTGAIQNAEDAFNNKLVDGLKYDDQVKDEIKKNLGLDKNGKINFISLGKYADAADYKLSGSDRIALIYAEGDIVDGNGTNDNIASNDYIKLVRKARQDKSVKAIVFRINSGGGSALASENIWRELALAKGEKPVIVSMGDVAASGGYYVSCIADSIFASSNTITGSIGVFTMIPNLKGFFNDKLGITFDGVKTAPYADAGSVYRPLTETEKKFAQDGVDRIYMQFKQRVAQGRKKDVGYIDSIAQGRVWSGSDALQLGLVDRIGGLQAAIDCAARMAKVSKYRLREYPEEENFFKRLFNKTNNDPATQMRAQVGEENYRIYEQMIKLKQLFGVPQARMPFDVFIH